MVSSRVSKAAQVAIVDADERRCECKREVELATIVDFDEHRHPERSGLRLQFAHVRGLERRDDQQDAVGAQGACLVDLVGIDHEVLAQDREPGSGARGDRCSALPWKNLRSVSTERQAAPCRA